MDLFISWSGDASKRVAELLKDWLPTVIQSSRPWISSRDIESGQRWFQQISRATTSSTFGIFCLTPENIDSKWIHYEAGALSRVSDETRIVGLLLQGLGASQISGPLSHYQHLMPDKSGLRKLVTDINNSQTGEKLDIKILSRVFERAWPEFESSYHVIIQSSQVLNPKPERPIREILDELLRISRDMRWESRRTPTHVERILGLVDAQYRQLTMDMGNNKKGLPPAPKAPPIPGVRVTAHADGRLEREEIRPIDSKTGIFD